MSNIKPSSHGIVVENKESGLRYASHDRNFDPRSERKVRDLKPGETVLSFPIKPARPSFKPVGADDNSEPEGDEEDLNPEGNPDTLDGIVVEGQK